ncbi:hypothetical protein X975_24343, partial [Stegodyphus mimosarum]
MPLRGLRMTLKYIDDVIVEFELRFADFKELESDISLFIHPLTIAIESIKTDYQLELCDLLSDPFHKGRTESGIHFFKLLGDRYRWRQINQSWLKIGFNDGQYLSL